MFPRPRLQSLEWYQEVLLLREACDQEIHKLIPDGYESDVNQNRPENKKISGKNISGKKLI